MSFDFFLKDLIEKNVASFSALGKILDISGKKIEVWYKDTLSWFTTKKEQDKLHKYDTEDKEIFDKRKKEYKKVLVPILEEKNIWPNMAIYEKNVWDEIYSIFSNRDTWKIAMMITTLREEIIVNTLNKLPKPILNKVKRVTMDLSQWFERIITKTFDWVKVIWDKFHVLCLALDVIQSIRVRYRQEALREEKIRRDNHKIEENERRNECEKFNISYEKKNLPPMKRYENWETKLELLARSRYLLFKFKTKWSSYQKERSEILFKEYPELKTVYSLIISFRKFYNWSAWKEKEDLLKVKEKLKLWKEEAWNHNIYEMDNFISTLERNEEKILEYFVENETNAYAESLNNKIWRFVHQNYWVKNKDFFHFRIKKLLS